MANKKRLQELAGMNEASYPGAAANKIKACELWLKKMKDALKRQEFHIAITYLSYLEDSTVLLREELEDLDDKFSGRE